MGLVDPVSPIKHSPSAYRPSSDLVALDDGAVESSKKLYKTTELLQAFILFTVIVSSCNQKGSFLDISLFIRVSCASAKIGTRRDFKPPYCLRFDDTRTPVAAAAGSVPIILLFTLVRRNGSSFGRTITTFILLG